MIVMVLMVITIAVIIVIVISVTMHLAEPMMRHNACDFSGVDLILIASGFILRTFKVWAFGPNVINTGAILTRPALALSGVGWKTTRENG